MIYAVVTGQAVSIPLETQRQPWSLSSGLWYANNPVDFAIAWNTGRVSTATLQSLESVLKDSRVDNFDEFGVMLLGCYLGHNGARGLLKTTVERAKD